MAQNQTVQCKSIQTFLKFSHFVTTTNLYIYHIITSVDNVINQQSRAFNVWLNWLCPSTDGNCCQCSLKNISSSSSFSSLVPDSPLALILNFDQPILIHENTLTWNHFIAALAGCLSCKEVNICPAARFLNPPTSFVPGVTCRGDEFPLSCWRKAWCCWPTLCLTAGP